MSDISTTAKVTLIVNGEQASQFINGLKRDPVLQCDPPPCPAFKPENGTKLFEFSPIFSVVLSG